MNNTLILREEQTLIEQNLKGCIDYKTLYLNEDFDISDTFLSEVVKDIINSKEYKNIFIPLCFGPIMSDFNGLRLATHIRCTPGINQNKNIYIFSFVDISYLINHECFDILKTKGVKLIKYNFHTIQNLTDNNFTALEFNEIPNEVKKINLQIPANYEDNHSVANEWAIYRWSQAIDANDDGIEKITDIQNSNLYFKYLKTIFPISHLDRLDSEKLKINFEGQTNILYIDDEADKGWREIFETIFYDKNENIDFSYLDNELNDKTKSEICDLVLESIKKDNIDIVILDFRLHKDDFNCTDIENVTGYQILKKIKEYNKGIQVIIFSATNKIWNLQALQEAGTDGFIIKESPENSNDNNFTKKSFANMFNTFENCINKKHLIEIYHKLSPLIKRIKISNQLPYNKYNLSIPQGKLNEYLDFLESSEKLLYSNPHELKFTFLQLIIIIEDIIKCFYISSDNSNHFVEISLTDKILCLEKENGNIILKISPIEKWHRFSTGDYVINHNDQNLSREYILFNNEFDRIPFNYRLNCVLYYKYQIDLQTSASFSKLYKLRSTSVAHLNENINETVSTKDIISSLELLNILIN